MKKGFIKPVSINRELLFVEENNNLFCFYSYSDKNMSHLLVHNKGAGPLEIKMPFHPLEKFKDRNHFLSKMKTLMLFS